jgi:uncharacterized sulfatase
MVIDRLPPWIEVTSKYISFMTTCFARNLSLLALLLAAVCGHAEPARQAASADRGAQRPNFVFVFGDDINKDSLPIYGGKDIATPNLDRLAAEGLVFDHAYASSPVCAPFRQELYSGRTPWRTRTFMNHSWSLPDPALKGEQAQIRSLPIALGELGYEVALVGKMHFGPNKAYPFRYLGDFKNNDGAMKRIRPFLKEMADAGKPFCLIVASHDGHAPYTLPADEIKPAADLYLFPQWLDTDAMRADLRKQYAEIESLDTLLGQVDQLLQRNGLYEDTLLMFSSEQGSAFPFGKWTCYADGLGTALVARWPGVIKEGTRTDVLVGISDVTPTFVTAAGGKIAPTDYDGFPLQPVFAGDETPLRSYVYGQATNRGLNNAEEVVYPIRVIRSKDYSLIWNPNADEGVTYNTISRFAYELYSTNGAARVPARKEDEPTVTMVREYYLEDGHSAEDAATVTRMFKRPQWEFYDLRKDPDELHNLYGDPAYAQTIATMKKALLAFLTRYGDENPMATELAISNNNPHHGKKKSGDEDD